MLRDIPTSDEFDLAAKAQFDFAWDIVISFLLTLDEAGQYATVGEDDEKAYWEAARQRVLTSLIIAQQGVELAVKARLVSVSPYLIIAGPHSEWPRDKDGTGVSFSEFRSIDAQDLVKVHNTVHQARLNETFIALFDGLRKLRNKAMHTVDARLSVSAQNVVTILLEVHSHLYPEDNWASTRRHFLNNSPAVLVYYDNDPIDGQIAKEFLTVFKLLSTSQVSRFFKVNKKQRLYLCPVCHHKANRYDTVEVRYAVLRPNQPDSVHLFCFVCNDTHLVSRTDCNVEGCRGNVISEEWGICCACGEDQV